MATRFGSVVFCVYVSRTRIYCVILLL